MQRHARKLLCLAFFMLERAARPSSSMMFEDFGTFLRRNGLQQSFRNLVHEGRIRLGEENVGFEVTPKGVALLLRTRNPVEKWSRSWDGIWRLVSFDLPEDHPHIRKSVWRKLRKMRLGCLHESMWLSPDPLPWPLMQFKNLEKPAEIEIIHAASGETGITAKMIAKAWNFDEINARYSRYIQFARDGLAHDADPDGSSEGLFEWLRMEDELWTQALHLDPLLPEPLLPVKYLGKEAWTTRVEVVGSFLENFSPAVSASVAKSEGGFFSVVSP